ncbi:hypothetical protein MKX03_028640 [Papaver bracteatum]|nr:hypothetical protein MKX03_028640 [Papaver bracteatum]
MVNLPWDILLDILFRLPLKSIVRFRCVNHFWNDEMRRGKFIRAHRRFIGEMGKFNLMMHHHNDIHTCSYNSSLLTSEGYSHIEYPVESLETDIHWGLQVYGCCFGLVLLRHVDKFNKRVLILWNPTTKECKKLPDPPAGTKAEGREYEEYALGYSAGIEDFKVVHLTQALEDGLCEVQVYTLKSNSWRRVDNVEIDDMYWHGMSNAVRRPVGGAAHWLAYVESSEEDQCIVRFEFETEEFDATLLPDFNTDHSPTLFALGTSVCLFIHDYEVTRAWELNNNGVEKSWTKLFTIDLQKLFGSVNNFMPLKSLRNGKIVLGLEFRTCLHIVLYDPKHGIVETLKVHELVVSIRRMFVYEESLHSLGTGTYLAQLQNEDDNAVVGDGKEE